MSRSAPKLEHGVEHENDSRTGVLLTTPFDEDFKDELKATVPWRDRRWSYERNGWWVAEDYAGYALELLLRHWSRVDVIGDPDEGDFSVDRTGVRTSQVSLFG